VDIQDFGWILVLGSLACSGEVEETEDLGPHLTGTISANDGSAEAIVEIYSGFAFDQGGIYISYFSSNPQMDCETVTQHLQDHSGPYDPSEVLVGGTCDIYYKISSDYDGEIEASNDPFAAAGMAINCYMGEGGWELETRDSDDTDYYWQGNHWQGHPTAYELDLSGGSESSYIFDIEMTEYDGNFIYEDFDNDPANGTVGGDIEAEWCPGLGTTPLF